MELCTFAQKVGRYQKKLPTFLCTEKGTYLLGGWGKILKVTFNLHRVKTNSENGPNTKYICF